MSKGKILTLVIAGGLLVVLAFLAGCVPATQPDQAQGSSVWTLILFMAAIFGIFYFLSIRPQRKRQKQHRELVDNLQKGDRIVTIGGMYGVIENINDETVTLRVESGTIKVIRAAIAGKQEQ